MSRVPTGGEIVASFLQEAGISTVFSLPGSQLLPIWDALDERRIRLVVPRSELSGAFLAEGFARASGSPAVIMNTLGPGVANELCGFASARMSEAPVVSISPFQPANKRERIAEVFQGLDHPRFFLPFSKWTRVVERAVDLGPALRSAVESALTPPRGPVRVEIAFPILFHRERVERTGVTARAQPVSARGTIHVRESPDSAASAVLSPGIGEPGHAIPFALGAKLACADSPVVVATETHFLLQHLDALVLARAQGVAVKLVAAPDARLDRVVRAFALERVDKPGDDKALSLVVAS